MQAKTKYALSGTAAGLVNGLFGGGGGMVLVPLLNRLVRSGGQTGLRHLCGGDPSPERRQRSGIPAAAALRLGRRAAIPHRRTGGRSGGRTAVPPGQRHMAAGTVHRLSAVRRREVYPVKSWLIPMAAGFGAGILSAWGVGGGTLLLLVMTLILGVPQQQAAAVNLLYFLPTAAMGVIAHQAERVAGNGGAEIRYPLGHNGCGGRCTGGDGGGHSGTAAAVRGISAAGGRRQPAAAMAGAKAALTHIRQRIV